MGGAVTTKMDETLLPETRGWHFLLLAANHGDPDANNCQTATGEIRRQPTIALVPIAIKIRARYIYIYIYNIACQ